MPGENLLSCLETQSSPVSSLGGGGKRALWSLIYKGVNLIYEGSTLITLSPPKGPHLLTPSHWKLGFNICILGTHTFRPKQTLNISANGMSDMLEVGDNFMALT